LKKKSDHYQPSDHHRPDAVTGKLKGHKQGYGFVIQDTKGAPDIYIRKHNMGEAMDGDSVMAKIETIKKEKAERQEGRIIKVLARAHQQMIGVYHEPQPADRASHSHRNKPQPYTGFIIPSNKRMAGAILIPKDKSLSAQKGDVVSATLVTYPTAWGPGEGTITKILGKIDDPKVDTLLVAESYGLEANFSHIAHEETDAIPGYVSAEMYGGRIDLRSLKTVTIDGETARDFDDAISIEETKTGYRLFVHITDVSHYIQQGTELDRASYARATSVYFPDAVYPMFPPKLSNGILSLNPKVDRLTLTAEMTFDAEGNSVSYKLYESVIHSDERMTYTIVAEMLNKKTPGLLKKYTPLAAPLETMKTLAMLLRKKRLSRGSLDFDLPEPQIVIALTGEVTDILKTERNIAHQIIEEFMLQANETVASHLARLNIPSLYRVHDAPDDKKIESFGALVAAFGFPMQKTKTPVEDVPLKPKVLGEILEKFRGRPEEKLINESLLRSMKQARYSEINTGHFGLASHEYTHFTSPVRRYPDMIVHRILKQTFRAPLTHHEKKQWEQALPEIARHTSERERISVDAERDVIKRKKIRFMEDKVGRTYSGLISGVTSFGFFVELTPFFVEGLVHIKTMEGDYYLYDEIHHKLVGQRLKRVFQLGDPVDVLVDQANLDILEIRLSLVEKTPQKNQKGATLAGRVAPAKSRRPLPTRGKRRRGR
jgi:ribonuclease R